VVFEQGEFDLDHSFATAGVLGEDVQYHRLAVHDVALKQPLEVALLCRAQ
jgi:hypothetical protein